VWRNDSYTPEYDHLALVVTMGGEDWLVDSGFGNFACTPIPIKNNVLHKDDTGQYSISRVSYDGRLYWQVSRMLQAKGEYIPEYLFTKAPQQLHDFAKRNFYHQTSPDSHFIRNFMCSRWAEAGRISIVNNFLIRNGENGRSATAITGLDDKQQLLEKWFQLKVDLPQRSALVAQGQ
jgi:N-hydroxyarylamine O-acetyltransferase